MAKQAVIRARCEMPLKKALEAICEFDGFRSPSEALRIAVVEAAERRQIWLPPATNGKHQILVGEGQ
jgi:antitoxin component of RelBE/YafQ-DinJ toxin-antitoxin module